MARWLKKIAAFLPKDKKFLTDDKAIEQDFILANIFHDLINPDDQLYSLFKPVWDKAPERVRKYYEDSLIEMKK